ncbi:MAG: hypothetical protein ABIV48_09765 [Pyrinomonadaceae bacterium]
MQFYAAVSNGSILVGVIPRFAPWATNIPSASQTLDPRLPRDEEMPGTMPEKQSISARLRAYRNTGTYFCARIERRSRIEPAERAAITLATHANVWYRPENYPRVLSMRHMPCVSHTPYSIF